MRLIIVVCLLFSNFYCHAQFIISGVVIDSSNNQQIPYALVLVKPGNTGLLTDGKGEFTLTLSDSSSQGCLLITSLGYDTVYIPLNGTLQGVKQSIGLNPIPIVHDTVEISSPKKGPDCVRHLGCIKSRPKGGYFFSAGSEVAMFIPNVDQDTGVIGVVKFYVKSQGLPSTTFRVNLYFKDSSGAPGVQLNSEDIFLNGNAGNEWVSMDISYLHILIPPDGFFVSMQWLPEDVAKSFVDTVANKERRGNGQVLAMSREIKSNNTWFRSLGGVWVHQSLSTGYSNAMIGVDIYCETE